MSVLKRQPSSSSNEKEEGEISNDNISLKNESDNENDDDKNSYFILASSKKNSKESQLKPERSRSPSPEKKPVFNNKGIKRELCKYFKKGYCKKGEMCSYSHNTKDFPCKYFHVRGLCENKEHCLYSHKEMSHMELQKFMVEHEKFILDTKLKSGKTKIDKEFNIYMESKKNTQNTNINNGKLYQNDIINSNMNLNYNTMLQYAQAATLFKSLYQTYPFFPQNHNVPPMMNGGEYVMANGIPMEQCMQMSSCGGGVVVDNSNSNVINLIPSATQDTVINDEETKVISNDPRKRMIKK